MQSDGLGMSIPRLKAKLGIDSAQTAYSEAMALLADEIVALDTRVLALERARPFSFSIQIGGLLTTMPAITNFVSDNNCITSVTVQTLAGNNGNDKAFTVNLDATKLPYNTSDQITVFLQPRSYRAGWTTMDNDIWVPIIKIPVTGSINGFSFYLERTSTSATSQMLAMDGIILKRGATTSV